MSEFQSADTERKFDGTMSWFEWFGRKMISKFGKSHKPDTSNYVPSEHKKMRGADSTVPTPESVQVKLREGPVPPTLAFGSVENKCPTCGKPL